MGCPSLVYLNTSLTFSIVVHNPETAEVSNADSPPVYRVYGSSPDPMLTGTMDQQGGRTGFYVATIAVTAANGFESLKTYSIEIESAVDSVVGAISYEFFISSVVQYVPPAQTYAGPKGFVGVSISDDFEGVCNDFFETVTLRMGNVDILLTKVMSEPQELKELEPAGAQVTRNGTLFVWSKKRSSKPPLGSIIIDPEGTYWTIWKYTNKQHVETHEAFCLDLNIITAPENNATLLKAVYGKGAANEAKATWKGLFSDSATPTAEDTVPARFQPSEETAELEFGSEWSKETYRVYFQYPVPMEAAGGEYRLVDTDGNRYRVIKYYQEQRIDRLPVAICVRVTEGQEYWNP
jgi:hypothetical protein